MAAVRAGAIPCTRSARPSARSTDGVAAVPTVERAQTTARKATRTNGRVRFTGNCVPEAADGGRRGLAVDGDRHRAATPLACQRQRGEPDVDDPTLDGEADVRG